MGGGKDPTHQGISKELTEAAEHQQLTRLLALAQNVGCSQQRQWAITQIVDKASYVFLEERIDDILDICADEQLDSLVSDLVGQGLWKCVSHGLQRKISGAQQTWVVQEAMKHGPDPIDFGLFILPHCTEKNLELALWHMVSRAEWSLVDRILEQGVSPRQHQWAIKEALKEADEQAFATYLLHHCAEEDLEGVLTHMVDKGLWEPPDRVTHSEVRIAHHILSQIVSRGLWEAVGHFLQRDALQQHRQLHRWAVEEGSKQAEVEEEFGVYVLPQCHREELDHVLVHLVRRGWWYTVDSVLEEGVSITQHRWAVAEALTLASAEDYATFILPHCPDEQLPQVLQHMVSQGVWRPADTVEDSDVSIPQHVLSQLMAQGLWEAVGNGLERYHNTAQHWWVITQAAQHAEDLTFELFFLRHCSDDDKVAIFPVLAANKKWRCVKCVLYNLAHDTLYTWIISQPEDRPPATLLWKFIRGCHVKGLLQLDLIKVLNQEDPYTQLDLSLFQTSCRLAERVSWNRALCQSLVASFVHTLCSVAFSDDRDNVDSTVYMLHSVSHIYSQITACINNVTDTQQCDIWQTMQRWTPVFHDIANANKTDPLFFLHCLQGLNLYHASRRGKNDDRIFLAMLAVLPLSPQLQREVLRMMLREKRWEVISQACLSHMWEHDREELFKAAVLQRQWRVVRKWADHTLNDDQRDWAMKEAFREKQWQVYLLLADHGLTMQEHMHACYILAKYGDWDTVLQMVERGGDITEVSNMLEIWVTGNLRKKPQKDTVHVFLERCMKLLRLRHRFETNSVQNPVKALKHCLWGSVLFDILHNPTEEYFSQVLLKVIEEEEWHILMHLVRLGMNQTERDWLFPQMVQQQQWGVCRKLLEIGVDVHLCLEALPELLERNQWMLVARVTEYNIDDAVRRQVMQCAFHSREGVLFWHCFTVVKDSEHMSRETIEKLFHQAISCNIWQAVKPLVEEKEGPGIQRRDVAFLEAIEQHLWDVVDHCQVQGADINMEDESGETPLHREARKEEWKAVEEIIFRDGRPNLLDSHGVSVLNRLINHGQWDIVQLVIKYGGNIHLPAGGARGQSQCSPLQRLIDVHQMEVIQFSIKWCPQQGKGVNEKGETTLHAACRSDQWGVMRDLVMRKVDPGAVTTMGQTALVYAVLNTKCPQRMVAECCRLGFGSHQPSATSLQSSLLDIVNTTIMKLLTIFPGRRVTHLAPALFMRRTGIASPFVCAVLLDLPVVAVMLYESGCSSYAELCSVCPLLVNMTDPDKEEGRKLQREIQQLKEEGQCSEKRLRENFTKLTQTIGRCSAFLRTVSTSPRTLLSLCRLLVSHRFQGKRRHHLIHRLPLPKAMKNYLEFNDFLDAGYGKHVVL